jgi:hypothetical protein
LEILIFSNGFFSYDDQACSYKELPGCYQTSEWNQAVKKHRLMLSRFESFFNHSDTAYLLSTLKSLGQGETPNLILHPWDTIGVFSSSPHGSVEESNALESRIAKGDRCYYFGTVYKVPFFLLI